MRHSLWPCLLLIALAAAPARPAALSPPGVNLRWDHCFSDGGVANKTFACDENELSDLLVCSFELAQTVTNVTNLNLYIDLAAASPTLPDWWELGLNGGSLGCRAQSLNGLTAYPLGSPCINWAGPGGGSGGVAAYNVGSHGPATARIVAGVAVPSQSARTLVPGKEYFAFGFWIDHGNTVGAAACGGCDVPVCIFLSRLGIFQPGGGSIYLEQGANLVASQYVTWQNGAPINIQQQCDAPSQTCSTHYTSFDCILGTSTRSRSSTWGQVKTLYR